MSLWSPISVGYVTRGCLSPTIYCAIASIRKRRCDGRYHRDCVANNICHIHKPFVCVEGNVQWTLSYRYGRRNGVCSRFDDGNCTTIETCNVENPVVRAECNAVGFDGETLYRDRGIFVMDTSLSNGLGVASRIGPFNTECN